MKRPPIQMLPLILLQAGGLGVFAGFQFLDAGVRSAEKAGLILVVLWAAAAGALVVLFSLPPFAGKIRRLRGEPLTLLMLAGLAAAALLSAVTPVPQGRNPSNWQAVEIQPPPAGSASGAALTLVEIKLDGHPLPLEEWSGAPGWRLSGAGLETAPGEERPVLIQRAGGLESGAAMLFFLPEGSPPGEVRLGWQVRRIVPAAAGAPSQVEVTFPAPAPAPWTALHFISLALAWSAALSAAALLFFSADQLLAAAGMVEKATRSAAFWAVSAFLLCYILFFFSPVFLNPSNTMQLENSLPAIHPIGNDMRLIIDAAGSLAEGGSPYAGANKYPPLAAAAFTSLLGMGGREAFRVLSTANLLAFIFLTLGAPVFLSGGRRPTGIGWMLFTAGLFTFAFHFEVERGQFNLLAVGMAFLAVILFQRAPRLRWLAYALLCAAVQLKIYPAIFALFLIRGWRDWKGNLLRWAGLGLANLILLLGLGWRVFMDFASMMTSVVSGLGFKDWPVSHSVNGFISFCGSQSAWAAGNARWLQAALYAAVVLLAALCLWAAVRRGETLDPYLLLACTLAALTLPSLSNDYTLAFLIGPAVLFFNRADASMRARGRCAPWRARLLMAAASLAFSSTFYSYYVKPPVLQNQFPALLLALACAAGLSWLDRGAAAEEEPHPETARAGA